MKIVESVKNYQSIVSRETLMIILGSLLIFTIFFPVRYVFYTNLSYYTGAYSDFTSFSLYISDIIILIFFFFNWKRFYENNIVYFLVILGSWLALTVMRSTGNTSLELYFLFKFYELFVVFLFFSDIRHLRKGGKIMLWTYLGLLISQILISFYQFFAQKSVGLYFFGESPIGQLLPGVARIVSHETTLVRAYGTFPHPNIFSAFLMVGVMLIAWQILVSLSQKRLIFLYSLLFATITTTILTFSRAGWLGTVVALATMGIIYLAKNGITKRGIHFSIAIVVIVSINIGIFHQFLASRTTITDAAIHERIFYNKIGLEMIKDHPISGLGIGSSVLHMKQYAGIELKPWEIQPIHNYYLLTAAETGLVGFVLLIGFFLYLTLNLIRKILKSHDPVVYMRRMFLASILFGFFSIMLFDHYFYTLQSPQIIFWIILGLIYAELKRKDEVYL